MDSASPVETWAVVVVYEDTLTRDRALAVCDMLVQHFWTKVEFEFNWWREAFLTDSIIAREASWYAANADLIIFSIHAEGELSAGTTAWIETWLDKRGKRDGALIGLLGTPADPKTEVDLKHRYLRQIAQHGGLDYLSSILPITQREVENSIELIHQRAGQMTSVLDQILNQPLTHASPRWQSLED